MSLEIMPKRVREICDKWQGEGAVIWKPGTPEKDIRTVEAWREKIRRANSIQIIEDKPKKTSTPKTKKSTAKKPSPRVLKKTARNVVPKKRGKK
jgi:hypothetical protein